MKPFVDLLGHFAERSVPDGECIVWTGYRIPKGYGQTTVRGVRTLIHRAAWVERHGPIPDETPFVLHRCDNPPCWRDEHLWLGTHADNMADRTAKRRNHNDRKTHCTQGHPYDDANTYIVPRTGHRGCNECRRRHSLRLTERRRARAAARIFAEQASA